MLLLRDCLGCISLCIILLSSKFNSSTFLWLPTSPPEYGTANYTNGTCYFDEMMKAYINIKNNNGLHTHQILNKGIWLMKRESGRNLITFLLASGLMKHWWKVILLFVSVLDHPIINSSEFQPSSSPLWERLHHPSLYAHVPTGNHTGTTARNIIQGWQKEKGKDKLPTPPQAFGKQKAIAH